MSVGESADERCGNAKSGESSGTCSDAPFGNSGEGRSRMFRGELKTLRKRGGVMSVQHDFFGKEDIILFIGKREGCFVPREIQCRPNCFLFHDKNLRFR